MILINVFNLYIGPGLGSGTIAVIISLLSAFLLSILVFVWYPFKRFIHFLRNKFKK